MRPGDKISGPYLHAGVVDNHLVVEDVGVLQGCLPTAFKEQAICSLHDVGFVDCSHLLSAILTSIVESVLSYSRGCLACNDLHVCNF